MAWSNPRLIELAEQFVPCADEVWRLQNGEDFECRLFRRFSELGHYRAHKTSRQGVYVATPNGKFLGSVNTRDPERLEKLLRDGLAQWKELSREERSLPAEEREELEKLWRWDDEYPADGLVLEVLVRDLPRTAEEQQAFDERQEKLPGWARWNGGAWNRDWAWFRKGEAEDWLPEGRPRAGQEYAVARPLVERLVRFNLVDCVRGQTDAYDPKHIERAELVATVESVTSEAVALSFRGGTRCVVEGGKWPRSFHCEWEGSATWDRRAERFSAFQLVAVGERSGRTRFNGRQNDAGVAPIGVVLQLAADDAPHVAPAWVYRYGWRPKQRGR